MQTLPSDQYELSPLKLWSPLQRQLRASAQTKGSPQQWIGVIRNLQNKGVSATEIEWSKVIPALEGNIAPISRRDELLELLARKPPCELVLQRRITNTYAPLVQYEKQAFPAKLPPVEVRNGRREIRVLHYTNRAFGLCIWLHTAYDHALFGQRRYWTLSMPRGKRKMAVTPTERPFATAPEAMAHGRKLVERMAKRLQGAGFVGLTRSSNAFPEFVLSGGESYTEWLITAPNLPFQHQIEHFELPNIVAHVRTTMRTTPQGNRLLVLEEIQSDWNQQLREDLEVQRSFGAHMEEEGDCITWDDDLPLNPYQTQWLEAALRMMLVLAADLGVAGVAWLPGRLHAERFPWANADGLKAFYDRIVPTAVAKLAKSWGAKVDTAAFPTLGCRHQVRKWRETGKWRVWSLDTGLSVSEDCPDWNYAEALRKIMESPVLEEVPSLYLTDEMRTDIRENGLPYLGAIGLRLNQEKLGSPKP